MPFYEYECEHCGGRLERFVRASDPPQALECPCGSTEFSWVPSLPAPVKPELTPYYDRGLGMRIESRQQRRDVMKRLSLEETGTTTMHGAKGTIFSRPGQATVSVPPSGAYAPPEPE